MTEVAGSKTAQFADIKGCRIYYEDVGAGAPILFSHCLLWNTSMYDAQVERLRHRYRCISYDHRGQGKSADHDCDEISVEMLCEDVAELITHLNLPPVHFVGHSLGGFVGIMLASRHPQLVRSLTLCNTSGDEEPQRNLRKYRLLNWVGKLLGPKLIADALMPIVFHPEALQDSEKRKRFRNVLVNNRSTVWRAANGVINRPSQRTTLQNIHAPTLVVTSVGDKTRTRDESDRLAAAIPHAQLVCMETGGHMLPLEEPERFADALETFLRDVP
jgi:pimeloyl-ACP methyl ester carboxylesterase